uniref:Nuclear speckle splicing regulatory protein 1 N-terminal domain-containing protein n=1 Tax=Globisporangium ultimum (strain ATCC 200006 / CBS 805.95 / DAOM BR144) TaxID=431595 RepID=K3WFP2_GLOUD
MSFSMKLPAKKSAAGKQYGLILPKKDAKKELKTGFNAFASASSDQEQATNAPESSDGATLRRRVGEEAARSFHQSHVAQTHASALAEDPSVFDYDGVYDEITSARQDKASKRKMQREAEKKQSKYIGTLLEKAKIREIENERIRDKRLLNERKADDALYEGKDKFISASYKKYLMERKKWDDEDARLDAIEEAEDVTKRGERGMADFYSNLLNNNISMGGNASALAKSAYTAGRSERDGDDANSRDSKKDDERRRREKHERREEDEEEGEKADKKRSRTEDDEVEEQQHATKKSAPAADAAAAPVPNKDEVISAAKARFLARKAMRSATAATTT